MKWFALIAIPVALFLVLEGAGAGQAELEELIRDLSDADPVVRKEAVFELGRLGTDNERALDGLVKALTDEEGRVVEAAFDVLTEIGPPAVPSLTDFLRRKPQEAFEPRRLAVDILGQLGPKGIEGLTVALDAEEPALRARALGQIQRMGPNGEAAVPAAADRLTDVDSRVRSSAARALRAVGSEVLGQHPEAVKALLVARNDADPGVGLSASFALQEGGEEILAVLVEVFSDADRPEGIRFGAGEEIVQIAPEMAEELFKEMIINPARPFHTRRVAVQNLLRISAAGTASLLEDLLVDKEQSKEIRAIFLGLYEPRETERTNTLRAVYEEHRNEAFSVLKSILVDPGIEVELKIAAARTLLAYENYSAVRPALLELFESGEESVPLRLLAARELFSRDQRELWDFLESMFLDRTEKTRMRSTAAQKLYLVDPEKAVPLLKEVWYDEGDDIILRRLAEQKVRLTEGSFHNFRYEVFFGKEDSLFILEKFSFSHPMTVLNSDELEANRIRIQNNEEPQASAYTELLRDAEEAQTFTPDPPSMMHIMGGYEEGSNLAEKRAWLWRNSQAAYASALAHAYSGEEEYAQKAVEILNAWAEKETSFTGGDRGLQLGSFFSGMLYAADLLYGYEGWSDAEREQFKSWWRDKVLVHTRNVMTRRDNNWKDAGVLGVLAAAVVLEDANLLQEGIMELASYFQLRYDSHVNIPGNWKLVRDEYGTYLPREVTRLDGRRGLTYTAYSLTTIVQSLEIARYAGFDFWQMQTDQGANMRELVETYFRWDILDEEFPWYDNPVKTDVRRNAYEVANNHFALIPEMEGWLERHRPVRGAQGDVYVTLNRGEVRP